MRRIVLILLFFGWRMSLQSQIIDTLALLFKGHYSIDARLESRNSFIDHQLVSVNGARLGLSFARKFKLGIGISWLNSEVRSPIYTPEKPDYLKFGYVDYYLDYVFYKTKRWQLSVPIQLGTGVSWYQQKNTYSFRDSKVPKYFLFLYEPGISVQFKVFKWMGFGTDVAYRFTLPNNRDAARQLSSPTYSFKLLFWFDQLFYDVFPESLLTKRFGPSYW